VSNKNSKKPPLSIDQQLLKLAKQFAISAHKGEQREADNALQAILEIYPGIDEVSAPSGINDVEVVAVVGDSHIGYRFATSGTEIKLQEVFESGGLASTLNEKIDQLFLRTSSGNIYLVKKLAAGEYHFINAKTKTVSQLRRGFIEESRVVIGSPFVAELVKDSKAVTRYTSPVSEAIFLSSRADYTEEQIHSLTTSSQSLVDEFNALAKELTRPTLDISFISPVIIDQGTMLGLNIRRTNLVDLFSLEKLPEIEQAVTDIFFRTGSGNVYRLERDVPSIGNVKVSDSRSIKRRSGSGERVYPIKQLENVVFELGSALKLGTLTTSALQEIVCCNSSLSLSAKERANYRDAPVSTLIDEYFDSVS
jgi:hypothetical protein